MTAIRSPSIAPLGLLGRFARARRGAVVAELAFYIPVLLAVVLGCYETTRYVLLNEKLDRTASGVADMLAQAESLSAGQVDALFPAAGALMEPYDLSGLGRVILSSVTQAPGDVPRIDWQREGAGSLLVESGLGAPGEAASLPDGFAMRDGENLVIAEVFYNFTPTFMAEFVPAQRLKQDSYRRPRLNKLNSLATP